MTGEVESLGHAPAAIGGVIHAGARSVSTGIHTTSETIGQLDAVQARINEVLEEQATMALAFERQPCRS